MRTRRVSRVVRRESGTGSGLGRRLFPETNRVSTWSTQCSFKTQPVVTDLFPLHHRELWSLYRRWRLGVPHSVESGSLTTPESGVLYNVKNIKTFCRSSLTAGHRSEEVWVSIRLSPHNIERSEGGGHGTI